MQSLRQSFFRKVGTMHRSSVFFLRSRSRKLAWKTPGIAIALLIAIVVSSYRQTILAYPKGGGAYIVSKDNLGVLPGLIAAAALLIDYVLTVAVSVAGCWLFTGFGLRLIAGSSILAISVPSASAFERRGI